MQPKDKRRLLRKWEEQRLALQSKIEAVFSEKDDNGVAIRRFTIDWENAGIYLYSSGCDSAPLHKQKKEIAKATRKCQPEISELAILIDRTIKEHQELYESFLKTKPAPRWPECLIEANRSLAGIRN